MAHTWIKTASLTNSRAIAPAAIPRLRSLFHETDIRAFASHPSLELYKRILVNAPDLKSSLLPIIKTRFSPDAVPTDDDYKLGLHVYLEENDIGQLVAIIKQLISRENVALRPACVEAIRKLSTTSGEGRSMALPLVRDAIQRAQRNIYYALTNDCPDLEDALFDLDSLLDKYDIPKTGGTPQQQNRREALIEKICSKAIPKYWDNEDVMDRLDEDDSDYDDQMEYRRPDLAGSLRAWR